jgi:multiple sugar transport system permease protein
MSSEARRVGAAGATSARHPRVAARGRPDVVRALGRAALYGVVWLGALTMLVPFLWMVSTSLKPLPDVFKWPPLWLPSDPKWENYRTIFEVVPLARFFGNTVVVSVARTAGVLVTSTLAGYAFARMRFPGRDAVFLAYLGTMMVPGQVTLIPSFVIVRQLGWIDTYYALIVPGLFSPFGVFLMRQFFLTIPRDLAEAATIDGASPLGILRDIMIPLARPALATLGVFTLLGAWNDFLWPLIVTNSPDKQMLNVGLAYFQDLYYTEWSLLMAAAVLALLPVLLLYLLAQRYFVEGIAVTGLKG